MTQHGAFSLIVNIRSGQKQQLQSLLRVIDSNVATNELVPFGKLTSIHFARFVVLDAGIDAKGGSIPDRLAFTTNYDQPYDGHLQQMVNLAGPGLWQIFALTEGFPPGGFDSTTLLRYFQSHSRKTETFYVGVGYRSVQQIHNENLLRTSIETFADKNASGFKQLSATQIRNKIVDFVQTRPELQWARQPEPGPTVSWMIRFFGKPALALLILVGVGILIVHLGLVMAALLAIAVALAVFVVAVLIMEGREKQAPNVLTKHHIRTLVDRETAPVQAQFSALGNVKPGMLRLAIMRFLLFFTDVSAPYLFFKGKLSGIPTVHFARWLILNEGRQMLFLSNYDGNSENYLHDFIHIAAKPLTLMFCHTQGYPKTHLLVFGGAEDAAGFMQWARSKQIVTDVWYSANPEVSVTNIYQNARIRAGLYGGMTEIQARRWLSRL